MKTERNYNQEFRDTDDHKYSYNFDFDVMHHYMLRSFIPFFKEGNFLEETLLCLSFMRFVAL